MMLVVPHQALLVLLFLACAAAEPLWAAPGDTRVPLRLDDGTVIDARIRRAGHADGPLPAIMLFGGLERGAGVLDLVAPSRPSLLASFDYPLDMTRDSVSPLRRLPEARRAIHATFEGIAKLYAELRARPDVDPRRITVVGVSLGAPFAVQAAARNGIPGLVVIHGFGRVPEVMADRLAARWAQRYGGWVRWPSRALAWALCAYADIPDIEDLAATLGPQQQVLMLSARSDGLVPVAATQALRQGFESSRARFAFATEAGGHLRGGEDPRIPELLERTERWMTANGL